MSEAPVSTNRHLYGDTNPLNEIPFEQKVKLLQDIDAYARSKDSRVRQVSASLAGSWQAVTILRADGRSEEHTSELQSLMRISYAVFCLKKKQIKKQKQYNIDNHDNII